MQAEILQALGLFALGMGTVFTLLSMLILTVWLMSKLCKNQAVEASAPAPINNQVNSSDDAAVVAATVAVKKYKNSKNS